MKKSVLYWMWMVTVFSTLILFSGCAETSKSANVVSSGSTESVKFAVSWSQQPNAAFAARQATKTAIDALGCKAKGVMFYVYYQDPSFVPDEASQATAVKADVAAEQTAASAVDAACGDIPNVGCRARCLVNGGTLLKDAVAVLAIGGEKADVGAVAVPILDNRRATGEQVASAMKSVKDLNLVIALAEMRLSFEAKEGVSVEDFIRGVLDNGPDSLNLFGGNSMPDDMAMADLAGAQFYNGRALKGHVVAMGIGGPVRTFGNHTNEFKPSAKAVIVSETRDKWVISFDGRPAADVYRELRGMKADEQFTSDWQHPIGVVVSPGKEYVRMILNWIGSDGKDKDGKDSDLPVGSLCFVAPVVKGTQVKVLTGGDDARAIVGAAASGISEAVADADKSGTTPALCLLSDCCARGMRLRTFRQGNDDEVTEAIIPSMGKEIPLFGFYAWGELGRIKGSYQGLSHQYQQHTFVSAVVGIE
jgi:hypothetical protein